MDLNVFVYRSNDDEGYLVGHVHELDQVSAAKTLDEVVIDTCSCVASCIDVARKDESLFLASQNPLPDNVRKLFDEILTRGKEEFRTISLPGYAILHFYDFSDRKMEA